MIFGDIQLASAAYLAQMSFDGPEQQRLLGGYLQRQWRI